MITFLRGWFQRYLSEAEAVALFSILLTCFLLFWGLGHVISPIVSSIVLAYLFEWIAAELEQHGITRRLSLALVYSLFLLFFLGILLFLLPLLWQQFGALFDDLPTIALEIQELLYRLPEHFPEYVSHAEINGFVQELLALLRNIGRSVLSASVSSIPTLVILLVHLILVPFMVFFLLKDRDLIARWFMQFLPERHHRLNELWTELNDQFGNYIRGKVAEMFIVGVSTYIAFFLFEMKYAALLAALVGMSVFVPYVGAVIVTIPVVLVAFFQWGMSADFLWSMLAYTVIQAIDGNVIVPLLFSEAVNLHPIAIVISIIVFGGLMGAWGMFFAIPLAIIIKVLMAYWPRADVLS